MFLNGGYWNIKTRFLGCLPFEVAAIVRQDQVLIILICSIVPFASLMPVKNWFKSTERQLRHAYNLLGGCQSIQLITSQLIIRSFILHVQLLQLVGVTTRVVPCSREREKKKSVCLNYIKLYYFWLRRTKNQCAWGFMSDGRCRQCVADVFFKSFLFFFCVF